VQARSPFFYGTNEKHCCIPCIVQAKDFDKYIHRFTLSRAPRYNDVKVKVDAEVIVTTSSIHGTTLYSRGKIISAGVDYLVHDASVCFQNDVAIDERGRGASGSMVFIVNAAGNSAQFYGYHDGGVPKKNNTALLCVTDPAKVLSTPIACFNLKLD
jgi:hypothetical protein